MYARLHERRVRVSGDAARDLARIRKWYSQLGAGAKAKAKALSIGNAIRALRDAPTRWPRGEEVGTRQRVIEGHVIVYEVENDTGRDDQAGDVFVLRIFGPGQNRSEP